MRCISNSPPSPPFLIVICLLIYSSLICIIPAACALHTRLSIISFVTSALVSPPRRFRVPVTTPYQQVLIALHCPPQGPQLYQISAPPLLAASSSYLHSQCSKSLIHAENHTPPFIRSHTLTPASSPLLPLAISLSRAPHRCMSAFHAHTPLLVISHPSSTRITTTRLALALSHFPTLASPLHNPSPYSRSTPLHICIHLPTARCTTSPLVTMLNLQESGQKEQRWPR